MKDRDDNNQSDKSGVVVIRQLQIAVFKKHFLVYNLFVLCYSILIVR